MPEDGKKLSLTGPMGGRVDEHEWRSLLAAMPHNRSAEVLKLSEVVLDNSMVAMLFDALDRMPSLTSLSLDRVGVQGTLDENLKCPPLNQLKTLKVSEAYESTNGNDGVCPLLLKVLEACQLRSLSISHLTCGAPGDEVPKVTVDQTASLGSALCRQTMLVELSFKHCSSVTQEGRLVGPNEILGHLIEKFVYTMPDLRMLDVSWSRLPGEGIASILTALKEGTHLKRLYLTGCFIDPKTVRALVALVKENKTLLSVSLDNVRRLESWGISIRYVDENELGQLTEALKHNTSLRRLRFDSLDGLDCSALFAYLERNRASHMKGGMRVVLNSERSGPGFPEDLVSHFSKEAERYLTERDALNLSSVNKAAQDWRHKFLSEDGPA